MLAFALIRPTRAKLYAVVGRPGLVVSALLAAVLLAACAQAPGPSPTPQAPPRATAASGQASAVSPADQLKEVSGQLETAVEAAEQGDLPGATRAYNEFHEGWERVEDGIKAKSPDAYKQIEDAMDDVKSALVRADKPDAATATAALQKLADTIDSSLAKLR